MSTDYEIAQTNTEAALVNGHAVALEFADQQTVDGMVADCDSLIWSLKDAQNRGTGRSRTFNLDPTTAFERIVYTPRAIPRVLAVGGLIESQVRLLGQEHDIPLLASWTVNHVIVNMMRPTPDKPDALSIKKHRDPDYYSGVVQVVSLAGAELLLGEDDGNLDVVPTGIGSLESLVCHDLAEAMTARDKNNPVAQTMHRVRTDRRRYSVFYGHDTRSPQTARRTVENKVKSTRVYTRLSSGLSSILHDR